MESSPTPEQNLLYAPVPVGRRAARVQGQDQGGRSQGQALWGLRRGLPRILGPEQGPSQGRQGQREGRQEGQEGQKEEGHQGRICTLFLQCFTFKVDG